VATKRNAPIGTTWTMEIMDDWTPTAANINALAEPLRVFIHDLNTVCDPAGDVRELFRLQTENRMLRWECERLATQADEARSHDSPPLVPEGFDIDVYVVLEDFGEIGRAYREVDEENGDRETLIRRLIEGQYQHVVRVVAFNTAQGCSRDVSNEIAREINDRASRKGEVLTGPVQAFVEEEMERAERRRYVAVPAA
jgi:hypothetical protein